MKLLLYYASMRFSGRTAGFHCDNAIAALSQKLNTEGMVILNLSDSNPTRQGLVPDGVLDGLVGSGSLEYHPDPRGLASARIALASYFGGSPDDYFLTASTSEAYSWLWKLLCDPGDAILVPQPGYPLFDHLAKLDAIKTIPYKLEYSHPAGWSIDIEYLRSVAVTSHAKALVLINPNNPTGSFVSAYERNAIVEVCADTGMALVADEVFFGYDLEARPDRSRLGDEERCLVFSLDGLSKLLCLPQFKLGWIRISGPLSTAREAAMRLEVIADAYLSAATPVMNALPGLLAKVDDFRQTVLDRLESNLHMVHSVFDGHDSPYRVLRCEGGWTALLEYPRFLDEEQTVLGLMRNEAVSVQPGYFFDMEKDGYLALSLILDPSKLREGLHRVRRYLESMRV